MKASSDNSEEKVILSQEPTSYGKPPRRWSLKYFHNQLLSKVTKTPKKSSALKAASQWRSAVGHAKAHSHHDVSGDSGLANTGPFVDYDENK